jgi:hypothetical protein
VAEAISRILADDAMAVRLGNNAVLAASGWSPDVMLDRYRNAYTTACAGAPRWA